MSVWKSLQALVNIIVGGETCLHARTNLVQTPRCCPDCGDKVKIEWAFSVCRGCEAKRICQRTFLGRIKPVQAFCRHCGTEGYRIIKKDSIEAYELLYAVSLVSTDYHEPAEEKAHTSIKKPFVRVEKVSNAFVEAEIVHPGKFRGPRRAFQDNIFQWNTPETPTPNRKLMLLR